MTTNSLSPELNTQRPSRPYHYTLQRISHISMESTPKRLDLSSSPSPIRPMENTVRILSALSPQLNVPKPPPNRERSRSGRETPSVDVYAGILESRPPPRLVSRPTTPYNFTQVGSWHSRTRSSVSGHDPSERAASSSTGPLKESTSFLDLAARTLGVRRGQMHPMTSKYVTPTVGPRSDFDRRSSTDSSSEGTYKSLRSSVSTTSTFLHRPVSYHCDDRSSAVIDICPLPEKAKKPRPPPLSIPTSKTSSLSESANTPDSMTPLSSGYQTARPWSNLSSSYSTTPVSSIGPDPPSSRGSVRSRHFEEPQKLPLLPPHVISSPIASASVPAESLDPSQRDPTPTKIPFSPSNLRASVLTGAAGYDIEVPPRDSLNSPRSKISISERQAIMRKRRMSDPLLSSFEERMGHDFSPLPSPKSLSPISLGAFIERIQKDSGVVSRSEEEEELSADLPTDDPPPTPKKDRQHDPVFRYTIIHGTDVLDISRAGPGVVEDEDNASVVESRRHPALDGLDDTESSCDAASIYSTDSDLPQDLNSSEEDVPEGSYRVSRSKRISDLVFRPASVSSSDTFTLSSTLPVHRPASSNPSAALRWQSLTTQPFVHYTLPDLNGLEGVGERKLGPHLGQDWIGEWSEPNIHQVISKLRALK